MIASTTQAGGRVHVRTYARREELAVSAMQAPAYEANERPGPSMRDAVHACAGVQQVVKSA